jgi:plasmid stabilization system protein ParE
MKAAFARAATRDFVEVVDFISSESRRAANRFIDDVEDALIQIGRHPQDSSRLTRPPGAAQQPAVGLT